MGEEVWTEADPFYHEWWAPSAALAALSRTDRQDAIAIIRQRLRSGGVRALAAFEATDEKRTPLVIVPRESWPSADDLSRDAPFWSLGDVAFQDEFGAETIYEGVRFDPAEMARLVNELSPSSSRVEAGPPAPESVAVVKAPDPRGAPLKTFWEDAILAVAKSIHEGAFKPTKQADIHRALDDWLVGKGFSAGDTAIKERARKIWDSFK